MSAWRGRVLTLALPVMLANATVPLVGIADTAVMGRMGAPEFIAATAVGALLFATVFWAFGFLRMGTSGLVAQACGADDPTSAGRITCRALLIAFLFGALLILLQGPIFALMMWAMGNNAAAPRWQTLTEQYYTWRIPAAPATLANYAVLGTLVGLQRMRAVLTTQLLLNIGNVVLNVLFFTQTDLGIRGVALATVLTEYLTLGYGLWLIRDVLGKALADHPLRPWLCDTEALTRFFRISSDLFIRTLCLTLAFYWMTVLSSRLGVEILAVNAMLLHFVEFSACALDGFAHAAETLTGFAIGRRDPRSLRSASRAAAEFGVLAAVLMSLCYLVAGHWLIGLVSAQADMQALADHWLIWVVIAPVVGIASFLLDGIFIGATETRSMRNGTIVSLLVFLLTAELSLPLFGNHGLWLAYTVLMIVRALTLWRVWPRVVKAAGGT